MSLRDTFIRVNRHRGSDPRTAGLETAAWAVLTQVWAIAADEGERDGDDVVVPASALSPERVVLELPRSETVEGVERMLLGVERAGCFTSDGVLIRVHNLATYNRDRFRQREARKRTRERVKPGANGHDTFPGGGAVAVAVAGAVEQQQHHGSHPGGAGVSPPAKPSRPKPKPHPDAVKIADALANSIKLHQPGSKPQTRSAASLGALGAMIRTDGRTLPDALALIAWLFLGGYKPRSVDFDWRNVCRSGAKLRKHWDALQALRGAVHQNGFEGRSTLSATAQAIVDAQPDD